MTYYVACLFTSDDDKELHYDIYEDYDQARNTVKAMARQILPYYLLVGDLQGMLSYTMRAKHTTEHISKEKFNEKENIVSVDAYDCIVPNRLLMSNYLPNNLDENGIHPETGYKYILHDTYNSAGEKVNGEAAGNPSN